MTKKKTGKTLVILAAVICLLMVGGSMAWLTSKSELVNTFTVGEINPINPDKDTTGPLVPKPDGGEEQKPIDPDDQDLKQKLNGNLYEPSWKPSSKLIPGKNIAKDPYVGVGPYSEASYVYVYVENTMKNEGNDVYFTINDGWEAVETEPIEKGTNKYTSGLFRYTEGLESNNEKNAWTEKPLFSEVVVSEAANSDDFKVNDTEEVGKITVKSFLHQKFDEGTPIEEAKVIKAAKEAFGLTQ